jgi:hypothetical protein
MVVWLCATGIILTPPVLEPRVLSEGYSFGEYTLVVLVCATVSTAYLSRRGRS